MLATQEVPLQVRFNLMGRETSSGFSADDRKMLYTLAAQATEMYRQIDDWRRSTDRRLEMLERDRAMKEDLDRMEARLNTEIGQKADRTELAGSAVMQNSKTLSNQDERLRKIENRLTFMWAYALGIAATVAGLSWLIQLVVRQITGK